MKKLNFFQRQIAKLLPSPSAMIDKKELTKVIKRAYEAAQPNDQFKTIGQAMSPNAATMMGAEKIRNHARYLDENHDLSISVLDVLVGKIIGKGIQITPLVKGIDGELHKETNQALAALWKTWQERPEITRMMAGPQADRLTCRTWLRDGEALNRFIIGNVPGYEHHSRVPMSMELIEPDYMPFIKNEVVGSEKIIQGVQLHEWGFATAYHILKQSPYEIYPGAVAGLGVETYKIPADQMLHIKFARRMTQIRGISIFHGVIMRLESVKTYEEAEQVAANVAAAMTGYIKKDPEIYGNQGAGTGRDFEMQPGMIFDDLLPGEEVGTISSDRPNTGLLDFRNALLRAVCGGTMTNFSAVAQYYDGTYSSQRQELVESKTNYDILRDIYVSMIKAPTYRQFVTLAFQFGIVPMFPGLDPESLLNAEYAGVAIPWIDPKKEMEAFAIAKNEQLLPREVIMRIMGYDPQELKAMLKREEEENPQPAQAQPEADTTNQEEEENEED